MSDPNRAPVTESGGRHALTFTVPADAAYLNGHFPDDPLVPGAQILAWLHGFVARVDPRFASSGQVDRVKFLAPLRPNMTIVLEVEPAGDGWNACARTGDNVAVRAEFHRHGP